ncbi:MAG TPA: 50S ribosomal protein L28 [Thermomicrobiales bacterium]|jgi:large subunit ribosomal protein L28|nr:50S ribosomal protein L28 [Thermomicrobiales bacterium]
MAMCEICGKTKRAGNNVSHSHLKTKRVFRPNIQRTTIVVNGVPKQIKACTRCIRTMAKAPRKARA